MPILIGGLLLLWLLEIQIFERQLRVSIVRNPKSRTIVRWELDANP